MLRLLSSTHDTSLDGVPRRDIKLRARVMDVVHQLTELRALDLFKRLVTRNDPVNQKPFELLLIPRFLKYTGNVSYLEYRE